MESISKVTEEEEEKKASPNFDIEYILGMDTES